MPSTKRQARLRRPLPESPPRPDTIDQVNDKIQELPGPAVEMLDQARSAAADVGDAVQDIVHRARDQATAAADTMHQQSRRLGEYLSHNTEQNPLTALLI